MLHLHSYISWQITHVSPLFNNEPQLQAVCVYNFLMNMNKTVFEDQISKLSNLQRTCQIIIH